MERSLTSEFHSDHTKVVEALIELRESVRTENLPLMRATLEQANHLVGPHFKFEELYLYPALKEFVGEAGLQRLLNEHDGVFRGVVNLVKIAGLGEWTPADRERAQASLELIWEHPVTCDGLSLYIERLPEAQRQELLEKMDEMRREGTTLLRYREERF